MRPLVKCSAQRWSAAFLRFLLIMPLCAGGLGVAFWSWPTYAAITIPATVNAPDAGPAKEIVYLDPSGVIRVLDFKSTGGPLVDWTSDLDKNPDGTVHGAGFRAFALGDVNNDGDMEIIGIRGGSTDGELVVYDPVVSPGQSIKAKQRTPNGIPWDKLYDIPLKGKPLLVTAGNFDVNVPGDEIAYLYQINDADKANPSDNQQLVILKATSMTPSGRDFTEHATQVFSNKWTTMIAGNFDGTGADELAMVDDAANGGEINVYRIDNGIARIGKVKGSATMPWKHLAFARWLGSSQKQLLAVRDGNGLPSFYVWQWTGDNQNFSELYQETFNPSPRFVFPADLNGNGKQIALLLRNVPSGVNLARLIPRGVDQKNIPAELEQGLDDDNGYHAGAAGDINGDGKDEIALIRDNKVLIFNRPATSGTDTTTRAVATDRDNIAIGDLDRNGFATGPQFCSNKSQLTAQLATGLTGDALRDWQLTNCGSVDPIPFSIAVNGSPTWFQIAPTAAQTPITLTYHFDAKNLTPGVYTTTVRIESPAAVTNQPLLLTLGLTVTNALVTLQPDSVVFNYFGNCATPTDTLTQTIKLTGSPGVKYAAAIVNQPDVAAAQAALSGPIRHGYINNQGELVVRDAAGHAAIIATVRQDKRFPSAVDSAWPSGSPWLKATSQSDQLPDTITLNADLKVAPAQAFKQAVLVIIADAHAGVLPNNLRFVPVMMLCTHSQIHLPYIAQ